MYKIDNEKNISLTNQLNIVQNIQKYGIIDTDETERLLYIITMKKRDQIIKNHTENFYHIWQNDKGVYLTYLPDGSKTKGRKPLTANTLDRIHDKIVSFYEEEENKQKAHKKQQEYTLKSLYSDWLQYKALKSAATGSIRRIDNDWKSYYLDDKIISIPLPELTKLSLEEWALHKVKDRKMTKTAYYNMSLIFRQSLDYAVDRGLLEKNPFRDFKMDSKLFTSKQKPADDTQVFLTDERPLVESEAWRDFQEKSSTSALAIPLAFLLGVRLGELVALKSSDIEGSYITVQRMVQKLERQRPDGSWLPAKWEVVPHTKTDAGFRKVYLTKEARRIISVIMEANKENQFYDDDFLFIDKGKRISPRAVDTRIRKYCDNININTKSTHKVRKTYISTLIDAGININEIRKQVGHEDERTTYKNYCFNRQTKEDNEQNMEMALVG